MSNKQILLAFSEELMNSKGLVEQSIQALLDENIPQECQDLAKEDYCKFIARVSEVAVSINMLALHEVMEFINENIEKFIEQTVEKRNVLKVVNCLLSWNEVLAEFLHNVKDEQKVENLYSLLISPDWLLTFDSQKCRQLIIGMQDFSDDEIDSPLKEEEPRFKITESEVSVDIPDDISPELLIAFQEELPMCTNELVDKIKQMLDADSIEADDISDTRRIAHTIKGTGNIIGIPGVANLGKLLEDILNVHITENRLLSKSLLEFLLKAAECLKELGIATLNGTAVPSQALSVLSELVKCKDELLDGENKECMVLEKEKTMDVKPIGESECVSFAEQDVLNVLVVDDSASARCNLSQIIQKAGYEVRTATTGVEAVNMIKEKIPDVVLTDFNMPEMNGYELTIQLRSTESTETTPIIMVTSHSTEKYQSKAFSSGVNAYLTKPFSNTELTSKIHTLLGK